MMGGHNAGVNDKRQQVLQKEQYKQQNPLFTDEVTGNEEVGDLGGADQYDDAVNNNYLHQATNNNYAYAYKPDDLDSHEHLEQNTNYLMGSMVSYMMPDGSPVKDQSLNKYPKDDDREDMMMSSGRMPTMQELYASVRTMDEEPMIIVAAPPSTTAAPSATSRTLRTLSGTYRIH